MTRRGRAPSSLGRGQAMLLLLLLLLLAACGSSDRRPAPAPPAFVEVTSVELERGTPREVLDACRQVRRLEVPPVCPRRYPASGFVRTRDPETNRSLRTPNVYSPELYELSFNNGNTRGHLHWVMGVGTTPSFDREILSGHSNETPGPAVRRSDVEISGTTVRIFEFTGGRGGPNSGHVIAAITRDRLVAYGSVHGRQHRDLAVALAVDAAAQVQR